MTIEHYMMIRNLHNRLKQYFFICFYMLVIGIFKFKTKLFFYQLTVSIFKFKIKSFLFLSACY